MPTDVSGTINIIAEVVGRNQTMSSAGHDITEAKDKRTKEKNRKNLLGVALEMKTLVKILTVGGLVYQSKVLSQSLSTIGNLLGFLVDVLLLPFVPLFTRGLNVMANILNAANNFEWPKGKEGWKTVWEDLLAWWQKQWDEKGGLVGIIKEFFLDVTGTILLTALLSTLVFGPKTGMWILSNTFGWGTGQGVRLTKSFLGTLLGWSKQVGSALINATKMGVTLIGEGLASSGTLLRRMFPKSAALFTKKLVSSAFGLVHYLPGGRKATRSASRAARLGWAALLFSTSYIGGKLGIVKNILTSLGIQATLMSVGKLVLLKFLFVLFVGAVVVTGAMVINYILQKTIGKSLGEVIPFVNTNKTYEQEYNDAMAWMRMFGFDPRTFMMGAFGGTYGVGGVGGNRQ
tara:strand:- start:34180 stop:35385 length:1206 start_codon:yes stop_codon:yes gene_type:complete